MTDHQDLLLGSLLPLALFAGCVAGALWADTALASGGSGEFCSQIVAIADFFDALRSNRPYRAGWETERILGVMREDAGTAFSPSLLVSFERCLRETPSAGQGPR